MAESVPTRNTAGSQMQPIECAPQRGVGLARGIMGQGLGACASAGKDESARTQLLPDTQHIHSELIPPREREPLTATKALQQKVFRRFGRECQ
jgi:hypothetical protein